MSTALSEISEQQIQAMIHALDSLSDGELAVTILSACGARVVPYLRHELLETSAHAIALPRCRIVRILGELEAYDVLRQYFKQYRPPEDAIVLFAEDAVRSAVAHELLRWPTEEVFFLLLEAAQVRASAGIVLALGKFHRDESTPLLFGLLEDDLCREEAKQALREIPQAALGYARLMMTDRASFRTGGAKTLYARRAILELLLEFEVVAEDWEMLRHLLHSPDPATVIATAQIGFKIAPQIEHRFLLLSVLDVSAQLNWLQETDVEGLLDQAPGLAHELAQQLLSQRRARGEKINWMSPSWRVLRHVLKDEMTGYSGAI